MGDAFYALDVDWRFVYANRRALEFWHTSAADVIGRVIWERFPQMLGTLNERVLRRVRAEREPVSFEAPSPTMGVWVSVNVGPSGDGVTVYWRDISARIEAEQAMRDAAERLEREVEERTRVLMHTIAELRRSRARYSAIFKNAPVELAFMSADPDGRLVCEDANPAWQQQMGFGRAEAMGLTLEQMFPPDVAGLVAGYAGQAVANGQPVEFEYTAAGGATRHCYLVPLVRPSGYVERMLIARVDLTEMRRVEAQFRQAQKMEAIGQLTGGVAHDFNNLLTAVIGNLELLRARVDDDRSRGLADAALRSAFRGGRLTQQLLAYARRQNLNPQPVDVNALIAGMGELLQRSLGGLVQVETDLDPGLWRATSDPTQLELVILNLAINARDAMPEGGRLRIATANVREAAAFVPTELESGDYVRVAVSDTGIGMSPEVVERACEPFFTTKEIGKGSGLGLAQVYGVAQQCGGTVRLTSRVGDGTTVEVFLPRALAVAPGETPANLLPAAGRGGGGAILLVDDDPDVREVAAFSLRAAGYAVTEAGSGAEAWDILASGKVNLALVDYAMPVMSGAEFVRQARILQPDLPVVYVTGATDALRQGDVPASDPVLVKPYTRASLLQIVREQALPAD
jgi:PAS domain S-box-containing protein